MGREEPKYIYIHVCTCKMGDLTSVLPIDVMSGETTCTDEEQRSVIQPTMVLQEGSPLIMSELKKTVPLLITSLLSLMMRMAILLLSAAQLMKLINRS